MTFLFAWEGMGLPPSSFSEPFGFKSTLQQLSKTSWVDLASLRWTMPWFSGPYGWWPAPSRLPCSSRQPRRSPANERLRSGLRLESEVWGMPKGLNVFSFHLFKPTEVFVWWILVALVDLEALARPSGGWSSARTWAVGGSGHQGFGCCAKPWTWRHRNELNDRSWKPL